MSIRTGVFENPEKHHEGWFRVFRFGGGDWETTIEIWFGSRWIMVSL